MITVTVALEQVWQGAKQLQKPLKILKNVGKTFSGTVNVIDKGFCKLSRTFSQVGLGLGWPEIALLPFTFWKLGKASVKVLSPSTSFLDRVSSTLDCTVLLDKLTLTAGFITKIVSAAGLAGRHAANWLNHFYPISAAISYVSCGLSLRTVYSAFKTFWAFRAIKNNLDNPAELKRAVAFLSDEGKIVSLRKALMISKTAGEDYKNKVVALKAKIDRDENLSNDDKKLVRTLAGRASLNLGFSVIELASTISATAGSTLLLIPTVGEAFGFGFLTLSAVISLVSGTARFFFLNKNPLGERSDSRAEWIRDHVREAFNFRAPAPAA